jgi:hypothetical protein
MHINLKPGVRKSMTVKRGMLTQFWYLLEKVHLEDKQGDKRASLR